jgi:hypothetical protein
MKKPPIAFFAYNRPHHLKLALEAISRAEEYYGENFPKIIYCDAARKEEDVAAVEETRKVALNHPGAEVRLREKNYYFRNITEGISEQCRAHGKVIVIEDDVIVSPDFLTYMMNGFQKYEKNENVFMITGFMYAGMEKKLQKSFFLRSSFIWGWGVWERGWRHFDWNPQGWQDFVANKQEKRLFDFWGAVPFSKSLQKTMTGKWNAWDAQWMYTLYKAGGLALSPPRTLVWNCGVGGGDHGLDKNQDPLHCQRERYVHGDLSIDDFKKPRGGDLLLGKSLPDVVECDKRAMRSLAIIFLEERLRRGERKRWRLQLKRYIQKAILLLSTKQSSSTLQ